MAKNMKLKAALDRQKGVNHKLERQKKLQKQAGKRKRQQKEEDENKVDGDVENEEDDEDVEDGGVDFAALERAIAAAEKSDKAQGIDPTVLDEQEIADDGDDQLEEDDHDGGVELNDLEDDPDLQSEDDEGDSAPNGKWQGKGPINDIDDVDDDDDSNEDEDDDSNRDEDAADMGEDIPLSDIESLASEDKGDVIPHQRLTINNVSALQRSLKSFALPSGLPFSAVQVVTSTQPVEIADVEDDLNRELAFYKQSLDAVKEARKMLKKEGVPFSRPSDYFAEMVKSEEHMGKVRQKMLDEAARKKASADARRQRDLKKFGKAVQVAKLQERDKAKRDTLDKISTLKRKRQGAELNANEDDMFDVALEDAAVTEKADREARRAKGAGAPPNRKRQKKDEKFGFGGKKRFAKSNDARSSSDMKGYSVKKMKGKPAKQRPGKSRRAKTG